MNTNRIKKKNQICGLRSLVPAGAAYAHGAGWRQDVAVMNKISLQAVVLVAKCALSKPLN